ncbi:MAG: HlyD family efflux transporter periplasmic adaptor subunit [Planctomycetota bacterium]
MSQEPSSPLTHFAAANVNGPVTDKQSPVATASPSKRSRSTIDEQLIDETKQQIRALVKEISELAKSDCSTETFFAGFLTKTTTALASIGGAIWIREAANEPLQIQYQINLKKTGLVDAPDSQQLHHQLLQQQLDQFASASPAQRSQATLTYPESSSNSGEESGNPTEYLLVMAPLVISQEVVGLVEIFQRPGAGPTTIRGYQRFVAQMGEIASDYLANDRIRDFAKQQHIWQRLEQFIRLVHQSLDTKQTAFTLANEGRRLIECDRVSVALGDRHCQVESVSGLDSIERRADQIKKLGALASSVVRTGQPLWYDGNVDQLPPQLESKLQDYVDRSHTTMLAIVPLVSMADDDPRDQQSRAKKPKPIGALIVEQLSDSRITPALRHRVDVVAEHGYTALENCREHGSIFLMPLWKSLGKLVGLFGPGKRIKTLAVLACVASVFAFLSLFPYEFGLAANGRLKPETQFEVFAQADGVMESINVSDTGDTVVRQGEVLGTLSNNTLDLAITDLQGKIAESKTQIATASQRLSSGNLDVAERFEINSQLTRDQQTVISLNNELQIRQQEKQLLNVVSPSDGVVVNWNAKQNLQNRPVKLGQNLMTVVPPNTIWLVELEMPERRLAHLFDAIETSDEPITVTFALMSSPGVEFEGKLVSVDRKLDVYSDDGNAALVRVAFDNGIIDEELLRNETRVTAKVHCGQRSIGYVMFHELIETVQTKLMFWF